MDWLIVAMARPEWISAMTGEADDREHQAPPQPSPAPRPGTSRLRAAFTAVWTALKRCPVR